MDRLQQKLIKPESTLIEMTALQLAATFWEIGRSQGIKSKHKDAKSYAKKYLVNFIPKAVELLMDILANPQTPQTQRDAILDAFLERTNDKDLANTIPIFDNPLAATFIPDTKDTRGGPLIGTSPTKKKNRLEDLPLNNMMYKGQKYHG